MEDTKIDQEEDNPFIATRKLSEWRPGADAVSSALGQLTASQVEISSFLADAMQNKNLGRAAK